MKKYKEHQQEFKKYWNIQYLNSFGTTENTLNKSFGQILNKVYNIVLFDPTKNFGRKSQHKKKVYDMWQLMLNFLSMVLIVFLKTYGKLFFLYW